MIYSYMFEHQALDREGGILAAFARQHGGQVKTYEDFAVNGLPSDALTIVACGVDDGKTDLVTHCWPLVEQGELNFIFMDNPYFNWAGVKLPRKTKRVAMNCWIPNKIVDRDSSRRPEGIKMEPWRGGKGDYILGIGTCGHVEQWRGCPNWLEEETKKLSESTGLPVVIRDRKDRRGSGLDEQLENAAVVVSHSSSILLRAMCRGIPTVCSEDGHTLEISGQFEEPDRWRIIDHYSYSTFTPTEIMNGDMGRLMGWI